jgi:hypothetical protein
MPYLQCPRCGPTTSSDALWLSTDRCARCDTKRPRDQSAASSGQRLERSPEPSRSRDAADDAPHGRAA